MICYNNYRSDIIKTKVSLDQVLIDLKEILNKDNNNLPIYNDLANILSRYSRNEDEIVANLKQYNNELIFDNKKILEEHNEVINKLKRSQELSVNKNNEEIKRVQDQTEDKIRNLKNEVITAKKIYLENIELAKARHERALTEAITLYDQEMLSIDKELKSLREEYRVIINKVENEKQIKLKEINSEFSEIKNDIETRISEIRKAADFEIEIIKKETEDHKADTDNIYLTIKKTHTQTSVKFNEFINERKKTTTANLKKLDEESEKELIPFEKYKETLLKEYEKELEVIQVDYAEKIKQLNEIFDIQKAQYNEKTGLIITENANEVSKVNGEFSALTRSIEDKKRNVGYEQKKALAEKNLSEKEVEQINLEYKRSINQLNINLANAIKNNNKAIAELEKNLQTALYEHDLKHIEEINEWRYNKNYRDYEYNKQNLIAKNKYNLKVNNMNLAKKAIKFTLDNNIKIENIKLLKDLLPIETQLVISSLVQEREINLLNTEDETSHKTFKLNESIVTNRFFLNELALRKELEIAEENKRFKTALVNIEVQLELEQLSLKRDQNIYILDLNKKLQEALLDQKQSIETVKRDTAIYVANLNINNLEARIVYETKLYRKEALMELEKRQTIIHEIKIKTTKQTLASQTNRNIDLSKNEANLHEKVNHELFDYLFSLQKIVVDAVNTIDKLFKVPAHPETFRQFLITFKDIISFVTSEFNYLLNYFNATDHELFNTQIHNMTEHKYRVKHEEIINIHSNNINQIAAKRNEFLKQYEDINSQLELIERKEILTQSIIKNYQQVNKNEKSNNRKQIINYNKKQIKILKSELKALRRNKNENHRQMIRLSNKVVPLTRRIKRFEKMRTKAEFKLNKKKHNEEFKYLMLQQKHANIYNKFIASVQKKDQLILHTINTLISEPYLSNEFFKLQLDKINKAINISRCNLINNQQTLLNNWLKLFKMIEADQIAMYENFEKISENAIAKLRKTQKRFIASEEKERLQLSKIYNIDTNRNNEMIASSSASMEDNIKNYRLDYRKHYENTEIKINTNDNKVNQQIKIIAENLKGVNEDITREYNSNLIKFNRKFKNNQDSYKKLIHSKETELLETLKRNEIRTNAIINQYRSEKDRALKQMKNQVNKYRLDIKALNLEIINNDDKLSENIKIKTKENDLVTKAIMNDINNYKRVSRKEQNAVIRKEKKTLTNSYKFKIKELAAKQKP